MDADKVLVLESSLEQIDSSQLSDLEMLIRIISSKWTRRLWTLQEGALAKSLYFQFADKAVDLDEINQSLADSPYGREYMDVSFSCTSLHELWDRGKISSISHTLYLLYTAVRYRSTSVKEDEALCLATLAGLDMEDIIKVKPPNNRMVKFWSLIEHPSPIVLFWSGKRLTEPGYRWAPASFLGQSLVTFSRVTEHDFEQRFQTVTTELRDCGLLVSSAGMVLNTWTDNIGRRFWVKDEKGNWYFVGCHAEDSLQGKDPQTAKPSAESGSSGMNMLALVTKEPLKNFYRTSDSKFITALMVVINRSENGIVYARIITSAFVRLYADGEKVEDEQGDVEEIVDMYLDELCGSAHSNSTGSIKSLSENDDGLSEALDNLTQVEPGAERCRVPSDEGDEKGREQPTDGTAAIIRGRLSIILGGEHFMFEGDNLGTAQQWCLD